MKAALKGQCICICRSATSAAQRLIEDGDKASAVERGALKAPCLPVKPPAQACAPANRGADKASPCMPLLSTWTHQC